MSLVHCPQCGGILPATHDGFCPTCKKFLGQPAGEIVHTEESPASPQAGSTSPGATEAEAFRQWHADLRRITPLAPVTPILIAINVLVFVAMAVAGVNPFNPSIDTLIAWGANFSPVTFSGEWWRLLTSAFLHIGIGHLAFNMFCLIGVGLLTERMVGGPGFLLLYLICAIAGSLASAAWSPGVVAVGASGAVFGVFGAFFAACSRASDTIPKLALDASRVNMGKLLVINLVFGLVVPNIDVAAHVGGLVCGFGCGFLLGHPISTEAVRGRTTRNLLLAVLSVPVIGLGILVAHSHATNSHDPASELARIGTDEEKVLKVYNDAIQRVEKGTLDDAGFIAILDKDVLAPWSEIRQRFNKVKGATGMNPQRMQQIADYLAVREEGFDLLRKAIATNDEKAGAQSREKMLRADQMVEAINKTPRDR
ncbi:MAG: hypothetical protein C0467_30930 [Planctomycetaceae bacterium]|nr:hypothetical protein [Planctomycetaceae bacterium]